MHPCHAPAMHPDPAGPVGEEASVEFPRARPHRRRRRLLRRLHSEALRGEQAGGGRPSRRLSTAVAAGAPGLHPQGRFDEAPRRRLQPALGGWQRGRFAGHRLDVARHRNAQRIPGRTPRSGRERL
eukprot:scaffold34619_cov47-Phaeocystis_antarctica.AAC.1